MYSIYVHTTPDGKKYVGVTGKDNPKKRWKNGRLYRHNKCFSDAIKFFGWENIQHEVVETFEDKETAFKMERYYILLWRTNEPAYGWNIKIGNSNYSMSETHRNKISSSIKGKHWKIIEGKRFWYE